ncbi:putative phosphoketolase [Lyngbya sp. PCC 8106]|nr:putative phosphoketolase [Lyngbya sp. PCC 8106]
MDFTDRGNLGVVEYHCFKLLFVDHQLKVRYPTAPALRLLIDSTGIWTVIALYGSIKVQFVTNRKVF